MNRMIMLIGPTGSGKTHFRQQHLAKYPCVSPDDFIIGKFSARKRVHAWAHARQMAVEMLIAGEEFVVDSQFIDPALRAEWAHLAKGWGYSVVGLIFITPWRQLVKNQKARGARGHYGPIPFAVQREAYQTFKAQLDLKPGVHPPLSWGLSVVRNVEWGKPLQLGGIL